MIEKQGKWDPSRVLEAVGAIGYRPSSALLDICDNSVSNGATYVSISINAVKISTDGGPRTVVSNFTISDNGFGMDEAGIDNALSLGSSTDSYTNGTLSKFGMGLKSASSSLGRQLSILSKKNGILSKAVLDQDEIRNSNKGYFYHFGPASSQDELVFSEATKNAVAGTVIIVSKIHVDKMPSVSEIRAELSREVGVVYYYHLSGKVQDKEAISFYLEGNLVPPIDPLFLDEINEADGNLNESTWDGCSVRWIQRPIKIQLDMESNCTAEVEITQLPHPPSMVIQKKMTAKECRDKYMIGAGNYGFYIYRNNRLISWANSLDLISLDQDLYSFRGRLNITSDSDNVLNIDVTKSRINLSEIAKEQLLPVLTEAKKKSILAWKNAGSEIQRIQSIDPHEKMNSELDKIGELVENEDRIDEQVSSVIEKKKLEIRRKIATSSKPATDEEKKKLVESGQRVQYVNSLANNQLWERAHDPVNGLIVRINLSHRLMRELIQSMPENSQLIKILDLLFFSMARGEYAVVYKSAIPEATCEDVLTEYRERVSNELSEMIKKISSSAIVG